MSESPLSSPPSVEGLLDGPRHEPVSEETATHLPVANLPGSYAPKTRPRARKGKLPENEREKSLGENHQSGSQDAVIDENADNVGKVSVGADGVTRLDRVTVFMPVPCSNCVKAGKRCTGIIGKACDRCRSQRTKCSISSGPRVSVKKSDAKKGDAEKTKKVGASAGVKRKLDGDDHTRKRPRREVSTLDSEAVEPRTETSDAIEELNLAYTLVGNYLGAYTALADWHKKEANRRARKGR